jgi:predicted nuclease with TOPRIM domain
MLTLDSDSTSLINVQELQEEMESLQDKLDALTDEQQTLLQAQEGSAGTVRALQARVEQHEESLKRAQAAAEAAADKHRLVLRAAQEELQREISNWADEVGPVILLGHQLLLSPHTSY